MGQSGGMRGGVGHTINFKIFDGHKLRIRGVLSGRLFGLAGVRAGFLGGGVEVVDVVGCGCRASMKLQVEDCRGF